MKKFPQHHEEMNENFLKMLKNLNTKSSFGVLTIVETISFVQPNLFLILLIKDKKDER